jgi:DNA-binding MarR family transcriptional regulator
LLGANKQFGAVVTVDREDANAVFMALLRVQKLLVAAKHTAPRIHDGVDASVYPVLFVVARSSDPVRISDLATMLHNDVSTVSRQVSALVTTGLLAKTADPNDGRALVVSMTDEGRTVLDHILESRSSWFQGLLQAWDGARVATFVTDLHELADALDTNLRARGAAVPPMPFAATTSSDGPADRHNRKD